MAFDGKLQFNTAIDVSGFLNGINNIGTIAQKGISSIGNFAQSGIQSISTVASKSAEAIQKSVDMTINGMKMLGEQAVNLSKQAVEMGKSFEASMSQVIATMGVTKDSMVEITNTDGTTSLANAYDMLSAKAKEMGATTQFSASEAADALNYLALAGYDAQKACNALPAVLNLAAAGGMQLSYASDLATDAMSALNMEATTENLTNFGDSLAKTASRANTSVAQLGEAILVCGGQATLAHMDLTQMNTALGILADNGIKGSEGGTALRNVLKNLYTPTQNAIDAMNELGIVTSDASGQLLPAQDVLQQISTALAGLGKNDSAKMNYMAEIFDTRTIAAASALLNNCTERWDELSEEINGCDGAMAQMAETMNDNLKGDIKIWESALEGLGVSFYESIVGKLRQTVQDATGWITKLDNVFKAEGFSGLASAFADVLSDAVAKAYAELPQMLEIGKSMIKSLCDGIKNDSDQLRVQGAEIITSLADSFVTSFTSFYDIGFSVVSSLLSGINLNNSEASEILKNFIGGISKTLRTYIPPIAENGAEILVALADGISKALPLALSSAKNIISGIAKAINTNLPQLIKSAKEIISAFSGTLKRFSSNSEFAQNVKGIIVSLAEFFVSEAPLILETGIELIEKLLDGMFETTEELMPFATEFIGKLCEIIKEHLPEVLQTGFDILITLIDGIIENIPTLVDTAIDIILSLAQFLIDNASMLIDSATQIVTTLCDKLLTAENIKLIIDSALDILEELAKGIADNLPLLVDCAAQIIEELMWYLNDEQNQKDIAEGASEVVGVLIGGMIDSLDEIVDFVAMLLVELGKAIAHTDWSYLGQSICDGILSGMFGIEWNSDEFLEYFEDYYNLDIPNHEMKKYFVVDETENNLPDNIPDISEFEKSLENIVNTDEIVSRFESAVTLNQTIAASAITASCEPIKNIRNDVKTGVEEALNNAKLDSDTYLSVNIGQERIEDIVISSLERYNARTGGRY